MTRTFLTCFAVALLGTLLAWLPGCASSVRRAMPVSAAAAPARPVVAAADTSYDAVVRRLAATDFETRARANRTLVAAGDDALPALGRAGDLPVSVPGGMRVSATRPVVAAIMADVPRASVDRALRAQWPSVRRAAAVELGRRDRWSAIPDLIAGLDDSDGDVRAAAAAALRRLTNNFFGFRAEARAPVRSAAADRWRTWWSQEGRARAAEHDRRPSAG